MPRLGWESAQPLASPSHDNCSWSGSAEASETWSRRSSVISPRRPSRQQLTCAANWKQKVLSVTGLGWPMSRLLLWDFLAGTVTLACAQGCPGPRVGSSSPSAWVALAATCEAPQGHPCPLKCPEVSCWGQMPVVWGILSSVGPSGEGRECQAGADQVRGLPASPRSLSLPTTQAVREPAPQEPGPAEVLPDHFLPGLLCPQPAPAVLHSSLTAEL